MLRLTYSFAAIGLAIAVGGCASEDGINPDGDVYDGIEVDTAITLLGTEPFWGLDIAAEADGAHAARFSTPDDIDGRTFALTRFAGNNGLGFSGELEGEQIQVAITPGECSDGMSDRNYPFAATVLLAEDSLFGCAYTQGDPFDGPQNP
ncbi:MAG: hypothetical protein AAF553_13025 [Pseudomonadota bacterium]